MDDFDLTAEYYHLRSRVIYLEHIAAARRLDPALIEMADLSRGIVHDLGNGLNVLRARLAAPPRRRGVQLASIRKVMETAGRLCDALGLRIYTLPELSPDSPLRPSPINLCEWLPDLLETFRAWLGNSVEQPCVEFHAGIDRLVVAEYDRKLRLAVWELLLNAEAAVKSDVRAQAGQPGLICVSVERTADGWAQIIVRDNGPGLPESAGEALLQALQRSGGAGVGLYVCHKIVEKHRGWLEYAPAPGGGTQARMMLPLGNPEPEWDDERELSLAMEKLSDRGRVLEAEQRIFVEDITGHAYQVPRSIGIHQEVLAQRFGALSVTTARHLEYGLARLREELQPLCCRHGNETAALAAFAMNKLDYLLAVATNLRLLEPGAPPQLRWVNLNVLAEQAAHRMDWRTHSGHVRVKIYTHPGLPPVMSDAERLGAALLNLLRNAIDAAAAAHPNGAGKVWIETTLENEQVYTRICDNGAGIPHQLRPRVFKFDYTSRSHRHYGLGLYLARRAVESVGGLLQIEDSTLGTTMAVRLPVFDHQRLLLKPGDTSIGRHGILQSVES